VRLLTWPDRRTSSPTPPVLRARPSSRWPSEPIYLLEMRTAMATWTARCSLLVVGQALLVLVALGGWTLPILGGDGPEYLTEARNLLHHGVLSASTMGPLEPSVIRAPGYPALLAALDGLGAGGPGAVRLVQLGLLTLTAIAAGRVAAHFHGRATGRFTTVLCITNLPLIWLAMAHLSEIPATLAIALAVLVLVWARRADRVGAERFALAGVALGAAAWIRPSAIILAATFAAAIVISDGGGWRTSRRWLRSVVFLVAVAVTVTPWAVRTSALVHRPVAMVIGSGGSMWLSAQQWRGQISPRMEPADWAAYDVQARRAAHGRVDGGRRAVAASPAEVVAADRAFAAAAPWSEVSVADVARHAPGRIAALWGSMGRAPQGLAGADLLTRLTIAQHLALVALALLGLWRSRRRLGEQWPLWLVPVTLTLQHLVFHAEPRYGAEARPLLLAYAAVGALTVMARVARARGAQRAPGAGEVPRTIASA
jgi:4-amino-4-deoxy-L-arabinose transferase-like glycosyltransferase